MLYNCEGRWFTTNAYNFGRLSPDGRSLFEIDDAMRRREMFKKHFDVEVSGDSHCCFLYYHGQYISAWSKGDKFEAGRVIQAAVNTYIAAGGK